MVDETLQNEELKSIGGMLLLARTETGLSQEDVAKKLHLSKNFIQYLEDDEFKRIGQSAVFIRGYIRSYARLVNIPEKEIIKLLDASNVRDIPSEKKIFISARKQTSVRDKKMRWITCAIIILFLLLIFIWWRSQVIVRHHRETLNTQPLQQSTNTTVTPIKTPTVLGDKAVTTKVNVTKVAQRATLLANNGNVTNKLHMDNG